MEFSAWLDHVAPPSVVEAIIAVVPLLFCAVRKQVLVEGQARSEA
jgi:hypothetical protein